MRHKFIQLLLLIILVSRAFGQKNESIFYYYQGEKIFLEEDKSKILVKFNSGVKKSDYLSQIELNSEYTGKTDDNSTVPYIILEKKGALDVQKSYKSIDNFKSHKDIISSNYMLRLKNSKEEVFYSDAFVIRLKEYTPIYDLNSLCEKYGVNSLEQNQYDSRIYLLKISKRSKLNTIELANLFYETDLFEFSEPNFTNLDNLHSNDPLYTQQWGLNSSSGINIEPAWQITTGNSNIKIAVIDTGVDLNHPDLANNLLLGFDATGSNTNGGQGGTVYKLAHGTACAGIIGASKDNNLGIAGIAPNCKIIPIKIFSALSDGSLSSDNSSISDAINWAWQNGADVLSSSWGGGAPSSQITSAINNAITNGREGLGCVLVFSSGNDNNNSVSYPSSLQNVISVGAILSDGMRSSYSNYGQELDVVAPGSPTPGTIVTTDISGSGGYNSDDYTFTFNGTSAACPHVAGLAALILSLNKCFTRDQVMSIIYESCDKVGGYSYNIDCNHKFSSWNNEMGHGKINAEKALQLAYKRAMSTKGSTGGVDYAVSNTNSWVFSSLCPGIAPPGFYLVKYHEVRALVTFPYNPNADILVKTNGFSGANPNAGLPWVNVVYNNTSAIFSTYVYEATNLSGQQFWIPTSPSGVNFEYWICNQETNNILLQNENVSTGHQNITALSTIKMGSNVNSLYPQGPYNVTGTATLNLLAGQEISFENESSLYPTSGEISATIGYETFICGQYPNGRISANTETFDYDPYKKDFDNNEESSEISSYLNIYPNPTTGETNVEYKLPEDIEISNFSLVVQNNNGLEVINLKDLNVNSGNQLSIRLSLIDQPSGLYIIKIISPFETVSKKFLKI